MGPLVVGTNGDGAVAREPDEKAFHGGGVLVVYSLCIDRYDLS